MNRWGLMSALALAAALLLAGCGGDCGLKDDDSADEPQITLEQIRAANDPRSLLEKHGAVTVTVQESDQNDAVTYTAKFQYTRGVEDVLAWYHCRYTENSTSGKSELWSEANGTMDAARMESDSTEDLSLSIYLEGMYEQYVLDMIPDALLWKRMWSRRSTAAASRAASCCSLLPRVIWLPMEIITRCTTALTLRRMRCWRRQ